MGSSATIAKFCSLVHRVNHFRYPRARARGASRRFQIRFHFLVQQRGPSSTAPRLEALAEPTVPPARLDANGAAAAAVLPGRRRWPPAPPRRRDGYAAVRAQEKGRVNHFRYPRARAREGRRADSRSVFIF